MAFEFGTPADRRGAVSITSGVNFKALTVIVREVSNVMARLGVSILVTWWKVAKPMSKKVIVQSGCVMELMKDRADD